MQGRDGKGHSNAPCEHASNVASNDGTLNAIINKSVRSLDVPLHNARSHEDEMLSWLHYPVDDPLDRGYCSDMFGDLPNTSAQVLRHSLNQVGLRPQNAPFSSSTSIFSGMLSSHRNTGVSSMDMRTALSESTRDAAESCGSGPAEASCRVAGADAVAALGVYRAADFTTSHMGMEVLSKLDSEGEVLSKMGSMGQPTCHSASANTIAYMQSEMSQTLSQGSSQQQDSFTDRVHAPCPMLKPLDLVNCYMPPVPTGKQTATNFALFSRPAVETKANLHMVGESSGPTNIERVRQPTGQHGMVQELAVTHAMQTAHMEAAQVRWLPPPAPPRLPLPVHCSISVELEKSAGAHARRPPPPPPPSSISESRQGTNVSKDIITNSRMSILSSEKGLGAADQTATSPSRYSASSTEKSGKVTDSCIKKKKAGVGEAPDYQSEDAMEMANVKKSFSTSKRMRTAEMHNQSERKRRVKINDKLRTLQELIPNGNKPDKASLLDAVIEYVKLLQSQLQVMSMRTGIGIPSWMIPNVNMQHLQMPALPPMRLGTDMGMGVGVGMGMRMGMGMMDANAAAIRAGCAMIPMPMYPGQPPTGHSSHLPVLQPADHLQARGIVNAHNFYAAPSQVQHPPMNLSINQNIPMYNAYIPQSQLQVHPQPQPQQQQFQVEMQQSHPLLGNSGKKPGL